METPPNYTQYPRGGNSGGFGGGRRYRGPGVYFDYIGEAFNMVRNNMGVYVVGALLALVIFYTVQFPFSILENTILYGGPLKGAQVDANGFPKINFAGLPVVMLLSIIPGAVLQAMYCGISLCALEEADTGKTNLSTMFSGFRNFLPLLGTVVLSQILMTFGIILLCIPFFFVMGALAFAPLLTVHEALNPIEAIQKSYTMLKGNVAMFTLFYIATAIVSTLGCCACGIGILFTFPILYICIALHYREFRGPLNQGYVAPTVP